MKNYFQPVAGLYVVRPSGLIDGAIVGLVAAAFIVMVSLSYGSAYFLSLISEGTL